MVGGRGAVEGKCCNDTVLGKLMWADVGIGCY